MRYVWVSIKLKQREASAPYKHPTLSKTLRVNQVVLKSSNSFFFYSFIAEACLYQTQA